jgi:hypothetical protein
MPPRRKSVGAPAAMKEVAFYYPGPVWRFGDWVKTLILFFDGVALLVPDYMKEKPHLVDPAIAAGLENEQLLYILEPEKIVDKAATAKLAAAMAKVIESGALSSLTHEDTPFHELSYSRLGSYGDPGLAEALLKELKARKLARDTEDGVSIPMHPLVRALVLVLLSQILRPYGAKVGLELSPTTDRFPIVEALRTLLSIPGTPSSGHVVSLDLETVGVDLASIPINEVLDFRRQHLKEHRAYARAVRDFVEKLGLLPEKKRVKAIKDRQEEIRDLANDVRRISAKAWKRPAYFAMTGLGAAWAVKAGDPIGAILTAGLGVLGAPPRESAQTGAFSYLFRAGERYGY